MKKSADIENLSSKIEAFKKKQGTLENAPKEPSKSSLSKGFQFCVEFLSAVFVAIAIGFFLDGLFHTAPIFLVILSIFGLAAGVLNVYRFAKLQQEEGV